MLTLSFSSFESPFPWPDSAHRGRLRVQNTSTAAVQLTGYTVQLTATVAEAAPVVLQTDDSDQHHGYTPVKDGLFLFITEKFGVCIEPLNFVSFPRPLTPGEVDEIPFYLYDLDLTAQLTPHGLPDFATAQARHLALALHAELRYDTPDGPATLTAEQPIELVD